MPGKNLIAVSGGQSAGTTWSLSPCRRQVPPCPQAPRLREAGRGVGGEGVCQEAEASSAHCRVPCQPTWVPSCPQENQKGKRKPATVQVGLRLQSDTRDMGTLNMALSRSSRSGRFLRGSSLVVCSSSFQSRVWRGTREGDTGSACTPQLHWAAPPSTSLWTAP